MKTMKGSSVDELLNLPISWRKKLWAIADYQFRLEKAEYDKIKR